jgi:hypothetical protein
MHSNLDDGYVLGEAKKQGLEEMLPGPACQGEERNDVWMMS